MIALEILWSAGLHPAYHDTIEKAALGAVKIIEHLRRDLADPDADTQAAVLRKLKVEGFCEQPERRFVQIDAIGATDTTPATPTASETLDTAMPGR